MDPDPHLYQFLFQSIFLEASVLSGSFIFGFFGVVVLMLCSALISGSEVAFFSLTATDVSMLKNEDSHTSNRILALKDKPRKLLATILISNNLINIAIVLVSDYLISQMLSEATARSWAVAMIGVDGNAYFSVAGLATGINFTITVVGVTFLLVLIGEVIPKVYAKMNNVGLAKIMAQPLSVLAKIFAPLGNILVSWTNVIENTLKSKAGLTRSTTREEIDHAIELTVRSEKKGERDLNILKGIVTFGDVMVKQIMRARVDIIAVDFRTEFKALVSIIRDSGFSRIPVFDDELDNITGILYVKDLLAFLDEEKGFEWQHLIRTDVLYVPESKKISDLLKEFQEKRMHMSIVVDEYGGVSGIATLEDIMEEVIGEIRDEFDDDFDVEFQKVDDYNYIFEGKTLLNDVCRILNVSRDTFDENKGDADSIAGLMLEAVGHMPVHDTEILINDYRFSVLSVNKRRIEKIKVSLPKKTKVS